MSVVIPNAEDSLTRGSQNARESIPSTSRTFGKVRHSRRVNDRGSYQPAAGQRRNRPLQVSTAPRGAVSGTGGEPGTDGVDRLYGEGGNDIVTVGGAACPRAGLSGTPSDL